MTEPQWTRILDVTALTPDKPQTIKTHGKQIVLFHFNGAREDAPDISTIYAIDNRCPHEGYPLSAGMLKDGILTCEWHNWKFQLCDGKCVLGGEDVRSYPLKIESDGIWLDLTDPPATEKFPSLYRSLGDAFFDNSWGWAGRTIERLLAGGEQATAILGFGCDWGAIHARYGFDHGLAVAADVAALLANPAWLAQAAPDSPDGDHGACVLLLEALNLIVEPNLRRPERELAEPEPVDTADWDAVEAELRARIEAENLAGAEGLIRGAIAGGAPPDRVFSWLVHAATDHFLGYGHSHIYCVKAEELLDVIGWDHAHPVLTSLVSHLVYETREDRLPYMRHYQRLVASHLERLDTWASQASGDGPLDADAIIRAVTDGSLEDALGAVADALDRGAAPDRIALVLSVCAAHRLMRFNSALEHSDEISEGWLHITHTLTHADAVRESLLRRPSAELLRGLFHSARFVHHLAVCDLPEAERPVVPDRAPDPEADDCGLSAAVYARDSLGAMAAVRHGLASDASVYPGLRRIMMADRASIPIFVAHHIKTAMAAIRLTEALAADPDLSGHRDRDLPAVATVRFLAHPLQERRVARNAKVARTFVRQGRMQTKLVGY